MRQPARSDSEARKRYIHFLQRSLQCVTKAVLRPAQPDVGVNSWRLFASLDPIKLEMEEGPHLYLTFEQAFHHGDHPLYPGEAKVFTDAYSSRVRYSEKPEGALFAWQHVPAGRVAFEEVLLFLIDEMQVKPIRKTFKADLGDSLTRFETYRSWSGSRKL